MHPQQPHKIHTGLGKLTDKPGLAEKRKKQSSNREGAAEIHQGQDDEFVTQWKQLLWGSE